MYRPLTGSLATLSTLLIPFALLAKAQQPSQNCQSALTAALDQLERARNMKQIFVSDHDVSQTYSNYPDGRSQGYVFAMEGAAARSVMNSPKLMMSLSRTIIQSCNSVGMVTFAIHRSDWGYTIGLISDGQISFFECAEDFGINPEDTGQGLKWGIQYCSI